MLSDRYFKIFGLQQTFAYLLNGTPFIWCPKEKRLAVTTFSHAKYFISVGILVAYGTFLTVQLIRYRLMGLTTDFYYYFLYALNVAAVFDTIAAYPFLRRPRLAAAFLSEFWRFLDEIQEDFMPTFDPNLSLFNMFFDLCVVGFVISSPIIGFGISCHFLFFPHWPCYLSSLVPPEDLTWVVLLPSGMLYFYGLQFIWAVLCTQGICFFTYGCYVWQICHEYYCFPPGTRGPPGSRARQVWKRQKTIPEFHSFQVFPLRYREFQILHLNFQEVFSSMIMPMQATITNLGVFCNFSLIKYKGLSLTNTLILLLWSVGSTMCALVGLTFCGTMYNKSVAALRTMKKKDWGSRHNNKIMSKFIRSCNPISYGYGRMYVIRMLSVFRFIKHLTRNTFKALLTLTK